MPPVEGLLHVGQHDEAPLGNTSHNGLRGAGFHGIVALLGNPANPTVPAFLPWPYPLLNGGPEREADGDSKKQKPACQLVRVGLNSSVSGVVL